MYINYGWHKYEWVFQKAPSVMRPVINRYGVQLLMAHSIPIDKPKESVIVIDVVVREILEEVFQIIGFNISKVLMYIQELITSINN